MGRMSASMKVEQTEKLRADMRYCMISTSSIEWCLANAKGQPLNFISEFFALEADRRHKARIANIVRSAGFPTIKSLDDYNMDELRLPEPMTFDCLRNLGFIRDRHTLIMHGICGSGKTMLSICLGMEACQRGYKVRFFTLAQLAVRLKAAAQEERLLLANIIMSSAYLTNFSPLFSSSLSHRSSMMFASIGESGPPCGIPCSLPTTTPSGITTPAFMNL